jgi:hypothetical protein
VGAEVVGSAAGVTWVPTGVEALPESWATAATGRFARAVSMTRVLFKVFMGHLLHY